MYAIYIELGYDIPHNFDYVARHIFFATTCNEHYIIAKCDDKYKEKGLKEYGQLRNVRQKKSNY